MAYLEHIGKPHEGNIPHSGRYKWGSGEDPYQGVGSFAAQVRKLRNEGFTDRDLSEFMGMPIAKIRARYSIDKDAEKQANIRRAIELHDKGYRNKTIGEIIGGPDGPVGESTIRNWLKPSQLERVKATDNVAEALKTAVDEKKYIDVGANVGVYMGVSDTKVKAAVSKLEAEGYKTESIYVQQMGTTHKTTMKILCKEDVMVPEIYNNLDQISLPTGKKFENNGESTYWTMHEPVSVDPKRVGIRYAEEGGKDMDGVIQIRPGVQDVSLGSSRYAQVRILVGEDRYLKGMAMYSDDLPDGVDLMFNTNKEKGTPFGDVLKKTKSEEERPLKENPFGASIIAQNDWTDPDGTKHQGAVNIVSEEGKWGEWSKSLSSQLLSKQPVSLIKKQLTKNYDDKLEEYNEIMSLTNPDVKRKLLESFADDCDASAVHLKAAAMPRQASHVILPFPDMSENEIYAPNYQDGETVVLIRYPHAGRFEIPTLTVNNKDPKAKKAIGDAIDAVGINPKVAERLSGADFDGDTVLVIPNNEGAIKTRSSLKGLKDFNPSEKYKAYEGMPVVGKEDGFNKGLEMGKISNLITDMTIKDATPDEIARAVRHSMVVIDAEKHQLNWKASYSDNAIAALAEKYQGKSSGGASTLISRKKNRVDVSEEKQYYKIDPNTGEKIYTKTGREYDPGKKVVDPVTGETKWTPTGKMKQATTQKKALEVYRAEELSSGSAIEEQYVRYSNDMKALGNKARKSLVETPTQKYNPSAAKTYATEVESLKAQLAVAEKNAPLERMAQRYANVQVQIARKANPGMDADALKKTKGQQLQAARARVGAKKTRIQVTPKEWEAIQAGAINHTTLWKILNNTDTDLIKSYATPRQSSGLTASQIAQIKAMLNGKNSISEVASKFGVSTSTIYSVAKS